MTVAEATPNLDLADHHDRAFLGHPRGLGYLAFTEAWERFSYYAMQTLLVLYMVRELLLPGHVENVVGIEPVRAFFGGIDGQPLASAIFGTYAALVYLTPILGGVIADRWIGRAAAVTLGAVLMSIGHFLMAFEQSFLFALTFLVIGVGFFKGNIASQVGGLYQPADLRRADAFQIFYIAINAGVIAAPLIAGTLGEVYGWHWGFGTAGVGMLIGLAIYLAGRKYLPPDQPRRTAAAAARPALAPGDGAAIFALILLIPVLAVALLTNMQIFNVYLVWGDSQFDLNFFGTRLPTTWLVTLDTITSVSALVLAVAFWRWYAKRRPEPDELGKILIGSVFTTGAGLCLVAASAFQGEGEKVGLFWPIMFHVLNSIGFANILPVSLALFAKVAPKAINATVIGLYYLAFFGANSLVGWIGGWFETMPVTSFWLLHAASAAVAGVAFLVFKLVLGRRLQSPDPAPMPA
jgi:POT family proton-dependent oligopeptide transporter